MEKKELMRMTESESNSYSDKFFTAEHAVATWTEATEIAEEIKEVRGSSYGGSKYFFTAKGVYRLSDHWGRIRHSKWYLKSSPKRDTRFREISDTGCYLYKERILAYASYADFKAVRRPYLFVKDDIIFGVIARKEKRYGEERVARIAKRLSGSRYDLAPTEVFMVFKNTTKIK